MKFKENKGITLIALVITIIILIILAGISIRIALGNTGIINKAQTASEKTIKEAAKEAMNLKITNVQIESYVEKQRMPTLQEIADNFCQDEDFEYVELETKKTASLNKIEVGKNESIFTKLKEYPYEFEIDSQLQLASIDGVKVATGNTETPNYPYVVEFSHTTDSYIKRWSNGIIEQGGNFTITGSTGAWATYNFPVQFPNAVINIQLTGGCGSSGWQYANGTGIGILTNSYFQYTNAVGSGNNIKVNWYAIGY